MDYMPGSFGFQAEGRRLRILDGYVEARRMAAEGQDVMIGEEMMSTSDFPTYIGSFLRHSFNERFTEKSGAWPSYTKPLSVEDFEAITSSSFGRFPDIPQHTLNSEYEHLALRELPGGGYQLIEWGAAFGLTRQLILSDHLGKLRDLPTLFAEAMARTISKRAVTILLANPTMWDGIALFHSSHANTGTTALTADQAGATALIAAVDAIDAQLDPEGYLVTNQSDPKVLIYPRQLRRIVNILLTQETLPIDGTATSLSRPNPVLAENITGVEEPYLTDATNWYLAVDPTGPKGFLGAVTLNGNTQPFLGLRDPGVRGVLGGDDPYSFDFDEVEYKIRHDFEFAAVEWRTVYGSIVA